MGDEVTIAEDPRERTTDEAVGGAAVPASLPRPPWTSSISKQDPDALLAEAERAVGERYRIERLAGEGGMGRVFAARDTQLGRPVAIKLLEVMDAHPGIDPTLSAHEKLVGEARAMAKLQHPNLCRVIEVSLQHFTPFLVMEWVDGVDLRSWFRGNDRRQRLGVFLKVVDAVAAMHAEGLLHGDIKPANILVSRTGDPTIVDFGLARSEADAGEQRRGGTPGYAAPEQYAGTRAAGPEADVFALGVVLFELLTDRSPYPSRASPAVIMEMITHGEPPLPERYAPETPADLQKICLAAMERDPADRYPDAGAMALDIRRYLRRETVSARPTSLAQRFDDQVQRQIDATGEWNRLGLITAGEHERLMGSLEDLQRADSPWVVDARKLSVSQVLLHLGGWMLVLGVAVGLSRAWEAIGPALGLATGWTGAIGVAALGLWLQERGQKRIGLGMLVTALLAMPAAAWLTLRETGWLAGIGPVEAQLMVVLFGGEAPPPGLSNHQVLAVAGAGLVIAVCLRAVICSAAFTTFIVGYLTAVLAGVFAVAGRLLRDPHVAIGEFGLVWVLPTAAALVLVAMRLDTAERSLIRTLGERRVRRRDAAPVLIGGTVLGVLGITLGAVYTPGWYALGPPIPDDFTAGDAAFAFAINGVGISVAMVLIGLGRSPLRKRVATWLRWLVPTHILGAIVVMEADAWGGAWWPYMVALPILAVGFCLASAWRQWKPFLIAGLAALAVWYVRLFFRIDTELDGEPRVKAVAAVGALAVGVVLMLGAWRGPIIASKLRLRRWSKQTGTTLPPLRERSWRG